MIDLDAIKSDLIKSVVAAVRVELRRDVKALLTVPETARRYRCRDEEVREAARDGRVKCKRTMRGGSPTYLIDAKDAERVFGAN